MPTATIFMPAFSKMAEASSFIRPLEGSAMVMVIRRPPLAWLGASACFDPVEPEREADGRNALLGAEQRHQPVEAAATGQNRRRAFDDDLEDQAGIIIERTAEGGAVGERLGINAGIAKCRHPRIKPRQGAIERQAGFLRKARTVPPARRQAACSATGIRAERQALRPSSAVFSSARFSFSRAAISFGLRLALVE